MIRVQEGEVALPKIKGLGVICGVLVLAIASAIIWHSTSKTPAVQKDTSSSQAHLLGAHTQTPAAPSVKAFDSANTISDPAWFTQAYDAGFRLYVLNTTVWGTCDPWNLAQSQIQNALAAGLKVAAYTRDPDCWSNGILATGQYQSQLQFFALDIETDPGIAATQDMVDGIKALGVRPVIYSGSKMWSKLEGKLAHSFSKLPLWDTNESTFPYDTWQADYLSPKPVPFGGWNTLSNMRAGIQQQLEYPLNGVNVDLDSFNADFLK